VGAVIEAERALILQRCPWVIDEYAAAAARRSGADKSKTGLVIPHDCADDWGLRGASIARAPSRINWLCCENWLATEHEATSSRTLRDPIVVKLIYEVQKSRKALTIPFRHRSPVNQETPVQRHLQRRRVVQVSTSPGCLLRLH
jgi:hypothetical protein